MDTAWTVRLLPGARVRLRLRDGLMLTGRVVEQFDHHRWKTPPAATELVICVDDRARCVDPEQAGMQRVPLETIESLSVRGKQPWILAQFGLYLGGLAGLGLAAASGEEMDSDTANGGMLLGMITGATLGALLGSFTEGWLPVFPCGAHVCAGGRYPSA